MMDIVHERRKKTFFPQGVIPHSPPKQHEYERKRDEEATRMETSDLQQQQQPGQQGAGGAKKQNSPSSSPEVAEAGFVMVPPSLAGDSSKHKTNQVTKMN